MEAQIDWLSMLLIGGGVLAFFVLMLLEDMCLLRKWGREWRTMGRWRVSGR